MSREKIKVPGNIYGELVALQLEIHFTQDHEDTIKKAEDRGYMNAANWIRQNERAYKIGFAWGFESDCSEAPQGTLRDIPEREGPASRRTISRPASIMQPRSVGKSSSGKKSLGLGNSGGIIARIKNWLNKYF
ncbi:MAG: hypothetical protein WCF90_08970 [Methanomicrobiales archaeon]